MRAEGVIHGFRAVVGQGNGGIAERLGDAARIGDAQGGDSRAGLHQQRIHVAVVAAFELDDQVPPGEAARHANGGHGGLGARVDQPDHFYRRDGVADGFGQLDFRLGGSPEAGADPERAFERREDLRMAVSQQQRSPGADVIDILVAVHVEDVGALAARDERRIAADGAECPHGRVDPAGNDLHRPAKQFFGFGMVHVTYPALRGTSRLNPMLMPISYRLPFRFRRRRRFSAA
jgi:hypothetical protein